MIHANFLERFKQRPYNRKYRAILVQSAGDYYQMVGPLLREVIQTHFSNYELMYWNFMTWIIAKVIEDCYLLPICDHRRHLEPHWQVYEVLRQSVRERYNICLEGLTAAYFKAPHFYNDELATLECTTQDVILTYYS